jgi:hypothetical protein
MQCLYPNPYFKLNSLILTAVRAKMVGFFRLRILNIYNECVNKRLNNLYLLLLFVVAIGSNLTLRCVPTFLDGGNPHEIIWFR